MEDAMTVRVEVQDRDVDNEALFRVTRISATGNPPYVVFGAWLNKREARTVAAALLKYAEGE
jgi:hypothetical protein